MTKRNALLPALFWAGSVLAEVPMVESRTDEVQEFRLTTVPPADAVPAASGRFSQLEMLDQMELLQQEVQQLRGQVENYQRLVSQLREENRTRYLDLEQRVARLQERSSQQAKAPQIDAQALLDNPELLNDPDVLKALDQVGTMTAPEAATAPEPASSPVADIPAPPAQMAPSDAAPAEQPLQPPAAATAASVYDGIEATALPDGELQAYEQARAPIADRDFPQAVVNLQAFIDKFPDGERTGHAWYWLGEVFAAIPDLTAARDAFQLFLKKYPDHPKARDASYKLAVVYHQLGDSDAARGLLQKVVTEHAGTSAAVLATNYLRAMVQ